MTKKRIPDFATEVEEAHFWRTHSIEEYESELEDMPPPQLLPEARTQAVSLRLSVGTLTALKQIAGARGIGYQTLIKQWLEERLQQSENPSQHRLEELVYKAQGALKEAQFSLEEIQRQV
jgi:predicted DNA binding CopG/RHH family protein